MKVATILGTRPEIIRLSKLTKLLDEALGPNHILINTNQNYDRLLSRSFLDEFGYRECDYNLRAFGSFAEQLSKLALELTPILEVEKPDKFVVLGDTNSSLGAIIAKRMGIKVYHLEAGNRSYNPESPEEINRKIIDHVSDVHMCYSERARMCLVAEGIPAHRTFVIGNPITEIINDTIYSVGHIDLDSTAFAKPYVLVSLHREENIDNQDRLIAILKSLIALNYNCIITRHPRLKKRLEGIDTDSIPGFDKLQFFDPFTFREFVIHERHAVAILTDSGTVQEEAAFLGKPSIILRDATERPECIENGSGIVIGTNNLNELSLLLKASISTFSFGGVPIEYNRLSPSKTAFNIILGHQI